MEEAKRKQNAVVNEEASMRPTKKAKHNPNAESTNSYASSDPPTNSSPSSNTLSLYELLDLSSLDDEAAISSRFDAVARVLLHDYRLVVGHDSVETTFEIQEIEFYLWKPECHEDPFTHGSEEQKVSGRWYFHRSPRRSTDSSRNRTSLTGYRGGTRKGLDLTIGGPLLPAISPYFSKSSAAPDVVGQGPKSQSKAHGIFGGILLRSLRSLPLPKDARSANNSTPNSVHGPSLLVDKILALSGASSISELVETMWEGDTSAFGPPNTLPSRTPYLCLKRTTDQTTKAPVFPKIHKSPRIGLDLSHPGTTLPKAQSISVDCHPRVRFLPKMYRYFTRPEELVKGRQQTFYGFIHASLQSRSEITHRTLSGDQEFCGILAAGIGLKDALVKKYLGEYEAGKKDGLEHLKLCIGPKGKGAADSAALYLKMMGALDAALVFSSAERSAEYSMS